MPRLGAFDEALRIILKRARDVRGVSQAVIAKDIGYPNQQVVSFLEKGRMLIPRDHRTREHIARAYGLEVFDFCQWCLLAEMERAHTPPALIRDLAYQPILQPDPGLYYKWSVQMTVLERVKKEVASRRMTPTELSVLCGLSYWRVYHTLAGHSGHEDVIKKLAKVLRVSS